jgi:uncharacterized protein (DUF488 family)
MATDRLRSAEIERNRLIRALRSQRQPLTRLSEAASLSLGSIHNLTRPSTIASTGYEGRGLDELLDALIAADVEVLVDVRENAISRKKGFSKRALAAGCAARGIDYLHEPTLGNPRSNRDGFRAGHTGSRSRYKAHLLDQGRDALQRVAKLLRGRTVALLCFEADPACCHRSIVADELVGLDPLATVRAV